MGFTSAWLITAHDDAFVAELAPRMRPHIEAAAGDPEGRRRWAGWERVAPLPHWREWRERWPEIGEDVRNFEELTAAGPLDAFYDGTDLGDDFCAMDDVWCVAADEVEPFHAVRSKEYAVAALFHALGPGRAARLPGWCGNFLLDSAAVRATLAQVEEAFSFSPEERAAAEEQDWSALDDGESALEGPLRCWREAAAAGLGLCGLAAHVY
ncbi:hypothetical protein [Streptomyces cavernicola]|uniref:DUF4253 domain-containing protein n=1 Tax=Streptomyces cavernicola TaxID=3043613 RepID=A0ABT6S4T2_9ACTN|nr:hypothetical protein [Streptomyces sp. B-S-A6]MDI3402909.1 hypothetical protein [Streptomyces sp. B-S-A6]